MTLYWLPTMPNPVADPRVIKAAIESRQAEKQDLLERARSDHDFGSLTDRQLREYETYLGGPLDPRD